MQDSHNSFEEHWISVPLPDELVRMVDNLVDVGLDQVLAAEITGERISQALVAHYTPAPDYPPAEVVDNVVPFPQRPSDPPMMAS
jgi:hypothetical protein